MINCPLCHNDQVNHVKTVNGYSILQCSNCNHRFADINRSSDHVNENYTDKYFFNSELGGYPNYLEEADELTERGFKYSKILTRLGIKKTKLLDVGAAAGFILKGFINDGWNGDGLEPNLSMVEYGRTNLGLQIHHGFIEECELNEKYDVLILIQVIAHFYNFDKVMNEIEKLLSPNGYVLVETWNRKSITAKILGWKWHEYSPPTVVHWFSKKSLINYFSHNGFQHIKTGRLLKRINSRHAKSLFSEKFNGKLITKLLGLIPDKLNIVYPSEDLFYTVFKKK